MAQLRREDAGNTGETFYKVGMQPANWYKWFRKPETSDDNDSEWTEVYYSLAHVECFKCVSNYIKNDVYIISAIHHKNYMY